MADKMNTIDLTAWRQNRFRSKRRKGRKNSDSNHEQESRLKNLKRIVIVLLIVLVFWLAVLVGFAVTGDKISFFLNLFGDSLLAAIIGCVSLIVSLTETICSVVKRDQTMIWVWAFAFCFVFGVILVVCTIKLIFPDEDNEIVEEPAITQEEQGEQTEQIESQEVYIKKFFSIEDDLFVEEVEGYYGMEKGAIAEEDAPRMRAELILEDIEKEKKVRKKREIPQSFWDNRELADFQYTTYKDQLERASKVKRSSILPEIKADRLEDLEKAKNHWILADEQYKDPDNQRLLALCCVDLSVEYYQNGDINSAQINIKEAAQWAVRSIYNAAVEGSKEKMEEGYKALENVTKRLEEMSGNISGEIIENVQNIRDACAIILQEVE